MLWLVGIVLLVDGVLMVIDDLVVIEWYVCYVWGFGFGGKLCIYFK